MVPHLPEVLSIRVGGQGSHVIKLLVETQRHRAGVGGRFLSDLQTLAMHAADKMRDIIKLPA